MKKAEVVEIPPFEYVQVREEAIWTSRGRERSDSKIRGIFMTDHRYVLELQRWWYTKRGLAFGLNRFQLQSSSRIQLPDVDKRPPVPRWHDMSTCNTLAAYLYEKLLYRLLWGFVNICERGINIVGWTRTI